MDKMDRNFARSIEYHKSMTNTKMVQFYHNRLIWYLEELSGYILDIGERNPLTEKLEEYFDIIIDNTFGDLDVFIDCLGDLYDVIIFNHVIEHLFNPLFCLENIKQMMHNESVLIIGTPIKPNFITTSTGHFHEMDEYRFKKLIQRAGLEIIDWQRFYIYNHISWRNFTGLRPFLMMFYKCHSIVKCIKK